MRGFDNSRITQSAFRLYARYAILLGLVGTAAGIATGLPLNMPRLPLIAAAYLGGLAFVATGFAYAVLRWRLRYSVHLLGLIPTAILTAIFLAARSLPPNQIDLIWLIVDVAWWAIRVLIAIVSVISFVGWTALWRDRIAERSNPT